MALSLTTPQSVADIRQEHSPYWFLTGSGKPGLKSIPPTSPKVFFTSQILGLSNSVVNKKLILRQSHKQLLVF